jgi:hypothetical protein
MRGIATSIGALLLSFGIATAEEPPVTIGEWLSSMDLAEQETWFAISGKSLDAANEFLKYKSQTPIFCIPPEIPFDGARYRSLLMEMIKHNPEISEKRATEFEPFLLIALRNAFPCPASE